MSPGLQSLLAEAYDLAQVKQNHIGAVASVKVALAKDDGLAKEAEAEGVRLAQVIAARGRGDHVSMVLNRILTAALAKGDQP